MTGARNLSIAKWIAIVAAAATLSACATTGPQITEDIGGLRKGVATTRDSTRVAFEAANKLAREQEINRKLLDPGVAIVETDFLVPVAPETAAAWNKAFGNLDAYAGALEKLVAPAGATGVGDGIAAVGNQLNTGAAQANTSPTVVGAFSALGSALVQVRSERKATAIMRSVDPAFQDVVKQMAAAVGTGPNEAGTLYVMVASKHKAAQDFQRLAYSKLKPAQVTERAKVLKDYVAALDRRDADEANLKQLRESLLALGDAHTAAAAGKPGDAKFWIDRVSSWLDDIKTRSKAAEKAVEDAR